MDPRSQEGKQSQRAPTYVPHQKARIRNRNFRHPWIAVLVSVGLLACQANPPQETFDGAQALQLAAEQMEFGPRFPGSSAHQQIGEWIIAQAEAYGWQTSQQPFQHQGLALRNIVARAGPDEGRPVILGAHYDTRPVADEDPQQPDEPVPGANDGASGVAVLLELARSLDQDNLPQPIWLVFFDAEDSGRLESWDWILGSRHFANQLDTQPAAVVIVDMVGDADLQLYYERNSHPGLTELLWGIAAEQGYESFIAQPKYSMLDDHTPFLEQGIPAVDIIDFDYPYWHTIEDTLDKLSASSLEQVGRTLEIWIEALGAPVP